MNKIIVIALLSVVTLFSCSKKYMGSNKTVAITAKDILGNSNYQAKDTRGLASRCSQTES